MKTARESVEQIANELYLAFNLKKQDLRDLMVRLDQALIEYGQQEYERAVKEKFGHEMKEDLEGLLRKEYERGIRQAAAIATDLWIESRNFTDWSQRMDIYSGSVQDKIRSLLDQKESKSKD